jgi:hypothetical protein
VRVYVKNGGDLQNASKEEIKITEKIDDKYK